MSVEYSPPTSGSAIELQADGSLKVPHDPIIPFIEGDGIGPDIWRAAQLVFDKAVELAYGGERRVHWYEVLAGEKCFEQHGVWLPDATLDAIRRYHVAIKGPLTTPVGGGIRSLNVTLRQVLDLYSCVRPVRYINGVPSPVKAPEKVDVVIFRENTEDVYSGIEAEAGSERAVKLIEFLKEHWGSEVRAESGVGIKPMSRFGTRRLVRMAIQYALANNRDTVTLVTSSNLQFILVN